MNRIDCPNCGPRAVEEFRYGGELRDPPSKEAASEKDWTDYLYQRRNPLGPLQEWWYHRAGCGQWFITRRHTLDHDVRWTKIWPIEEGS